MSTAFWSSQKYVTYSAPTFYNPPSCLFETNLDPLDKRTFIIPRVNSEYMGKHSLRYFGPVVWEQMLPVRYKEITSLDKFKQEIKRWVPDNCKYRLCKTYVGVLGFVNITE